MADWFETRFREPVDPGRLDPAFAARMRALVMEEWQAQAATIPPADMDPHDRDGDLIMLETEDRPTADEPVTVRRSPGRWLLAAAAVAVLAVVGALVVAAGDDDDPVDTVTSIPTNAPVKDI